MKKMLLLIPICILVGAGAAYLIMDQRSSNGEALQLSREDIGCQADLPGTPGTAKEVPVRDAAGASGIAIAGATASVAFSAGDPYESQSFLRMELSGSDGVSSADSVMYDVRADEQTGPLNVLTFEDGDTVVRLQCRGKDV